MTRPTKERKPAHAPRKRRLTELTIRKARPDKHAAYLIWDTYQRGLALSVQPTGTKSWKVIYSRAGRPRWLHIGNANAIGLAAARELAAECMLAVARGKDPAAERKAGRGKGTFAELAARYVEEHAKDENKSWKQADFLVRRYLLPRWGKLQAAAVVRADVDSALAKIKDRPTLSNAVLASASAIFSWAIKKDILAIVNPCAKIERNETNGRARVLSDSEVPKFWQAFDAAGLVKSSALKTILLTGQRPGEVAAMRWEHIDGNLWTMPGLPEPKTGWRGTKNSEAHDVALSAPVRAILAELGDGKQTSGFVFAGCSRNMLTSAMRDICAALKIENTVRPHDLRRSFATTAASLDISDEGIDRLLNHKLPKKSVRRVYNQHKYREENRIAWEKVAAKIMELAEGVVAETNIVALPAGRGPGYSKYKTSANYSAMVARNLADQAAAMVPKPER